MRINDENFGATLEKLSSGLRVNSAKDDSASLAVAVAFTATQRGNSAAMRNLNEGIAMVQLAQFSVSDVTKRLQRVRDIAIASTNNAITDKQRANLQEEVDQLTQGISSIIQTANFNSKLLLSGSETYTFQVGASGTTNNQITVDVPSLTGIVGFANDLSASGTIDLTTSAGAFATISAIDESIISLSENLSTYGSVENRFLRVMDNLSYMNADLDTALERIQGTDYAQVTERLKRYEVMQQAGAAILAQANVVPQTALNLLR